MTTALALRVDRKLEKTSAGVLAPADLGTLWTPRSDPQRMALESEADEVYYGGAAGGGKTDLLIGAALTQHRRSVIFRREYAQHSAIIDRVTEVLAPIADQVAYNGTERRWRLPGSRILELGAAQHEDSVRKWRGRPHDGKFFDELPEFTEAQYLFFCGLGADHGPGPAGPDDRGRQPADRRRRRVGDPALGAVAGRAAPEPGRARASCAGSSGSTARTPRSKGRSRSSWKGETLYPRSRTFIPAKLADNAVPLQRPELPRHAPGAPRAAPVPAALRRPQHRPAGRRVAGDPDGVGARRAGALDAGAAGREARPVDRRSAPTSRRAGADRPCWPGGTGPGSRAGGASPAQTSRTPGATPSTSSGRCSTGGVAYIDGDGIGATTYFLAPRRSIGERVRATEGRRPDRLSGTGRAC